MALLALRAHLPAVNIGVAIRALVSHLREDWFGVALHAGDILVHAAQREVGLAVVEVRKAADRLPGREGMAILAGDL